MALPVQPCPCVPYETNCCCGPLNGISIVEPSCQTIPSRVVNNPAYDPQEDKSYWSYKFITDCAPSTRGISNFVIPICESIPREFIIAEEKIDGCGEFKEVDFSLSLSDPNFNDAPEGFQWLKIQTMDRYEKGVCVEYRLTITGNYPVATLPIEVFAANVVYVFNCEDCFSVPACNPEGVLAVDKECSVNISNNQATLNYVVEVDNVGNALLENVQYEDTIIIPSQLTIGQIVVEPPTLNVVTSPQGQVTISGSIGDIAPGGQVIVTYTIPITTVSTAGSFLIENTVFVFAEGTQASDTCINTLEVVQFSAKKCCTITETGAIAFRIQVTNLPNSPATNFNLQDHIIIPTGIVVQFTDFNGCAATFQGTTDPVPINTNIIGPAIIEISCNNVPILDGGIAEKVLTLSLVSSSTIGSVNLLNTLQAVALTSPNEQIYLGAGSLPITATVSISLDVTCNNPC